MTAAGQDAKNRFFNCVRAHGQGQINWHFRKEGMTKILLPTKKEFCEKRGRFSLFFPTTKPRTLYVSGFKITRCMSNLLVWELFGAPPPPPQSADGDNISSPFSASNYKIGENIFSLFFLRLALCQRAWVFGGQQIEPFNQVVAGGGGDGERRICHIQWYWMLSKRGTIYRPPAGIKVFRLESGKHKRQVPTVRYFRIANSPTPFSLFLGRETQHSNKLEGFFVLLAA